MQQKTNYYDLLQVPQWASAAVVRARFLELLQFYNPATYRPASEAEAMRAKLHEAYSVLGDVELRNEYDRFIGNNAASSRSSSDANGQPPPLSQPQTRHETSKPKSEPGWIGWLAMLMLLYFCGKIGGYLIGGGLSYFAGVAFGGVLYSLGLFLWKKANILGKLAILMGWATTCFLGVVLNQMRISESSRKSTAQTHHAAGPWDNYAQAQEQAQATAQATAQPQPYQQSSAPLTEAQLEAQKAWDNRINAWKTANSEFLSDPARAKEMDAAIQSLDESNPSLSDSELLQQAQDLAFVRTGWGQHVQTAVTYAAPPAKLSIPAAASIPRNVVVETVQIGSMTTSGAPQFIQLSTVREGDPVALMVRGLDNGASSAGILTATWSDEKGQVIETRSLPLDAGGTTIFDLATMVGPGNVLVVLSLDGTPVSKKSIRVM